MKTQSRRTSRAVRLPLALLAAASALMLASCGSHQPSGSHPGSASWGQPQRTGWTSSPQLREAEEKSIARDMPYASVTASGSVVQN